MIKDKFKGCLIGGASGDALGYTVEFLEYEQIQSLYGEKGITEYTLTDNVALVSDDTQMTLFTANGLLRGITEQVSSFSRKKTDEYIYEAYLDWLNTQIDRSTEDSKSWLTKHKEIYGKRAPGNTCLKVLASGKRGYVNDRVNDRQGCGGIMRVAPIGLIYKNRKDVFNIASEAAAITHNHPLGYLPAAMFALIINSIIYRTFGILRKPCKNKNDYTNIIRICQKEILEYCQSEDLEYALEINNRIDEAISLTSNQLSDADNVRTLGFGWVAKETLTIAIYCSLKYFNDFGTALAVAVNHSGDSDSTGSVTGNILGAYYGYEKIDDKWKEKLDLYDIIIQMAQDLYFGYQILHREAPITESWKRKYDLE